MTLIAHLTWQHGIRIIDGLNFLTFHTYQSAVVIDTGNTIPLHDIWSFIIKLYVIESFFNLPVKMLNSHFASWILPTPNDPWMKEFKWDMMGNFIKQLVCNIKLAVFFECLICPDNLKRQIGHRIDKRIDILAF